MAHRKSREHLVGIARKNASHYVAGYDPKKWDNFDQLSTEKQQAEINKSEYWNEKQMTTKSRRAGQSLSTEDENIDVAAKSSESRNRIARDEAYKRWREGTRKQRDAVRKMAKEQGLTTGQFIKKYRL